jgi:hypothetical protein
MASKASRDPITPEPFWFLNPQLGRLAILEHRFVTQWIHDDGAAADWIQDLLTRGWLPWHAGVEIDELDDAQTVIRANRMTLPGAVLRWFWQTRDCTPITWNSSSTIYVGPSILTGKDPDGVEYPITDGRGRVRIKLHLIRFYHPVLVFRLRSDGLMPWPEKSPAELPAEGVKSNDAELNPTKYGMPVLDFPDYKAIQAFVIKTWGLKWRDVTVKTMRDVGFKDVEFKKLFSPFPDRTKWRRALGLRED